MEHLGHFEQLFIRALDPFQRVEVNDREDHQHRDDHGQITAREPQQDQNNKGCDRRGFDDDRDGTEQCFDDPQS